MAVSAEKAIWSSDYTVGSDKIDNQHKKLFKIYNRLVEATANSENPNRDNHDIMVELVNYFVNHFADEEEIWKVNEKIYNRQSKSHFSFVEKMIDVSQKNPRYHNLNAELLIFIKGWLIDHIIKQDIKDYHKIKT